MARPLAVGDKVVYRLFNLISGRSYGPLGIGVIMKIAPGEREWQSDEIMYTVRRSNGSQIELHHKEIKRRLS